MKCPTLEFVLNGNQNNSATPLADILRSPCKSEWVKKHDVYTDHEYLPIDKVILLLNRIWHTNWNKEILSSVITEKYVQVTVRIHLYHYDSEEWIYHDGGAISTIKDDSSGAYQAAISEAIKDAMGVYPIFGSELNLNQTSQNLASSKSVWNKTIKLFDELKNRMIQEDIEYIEEAIKNKDESKRVECHKKLMAFKVANSRRK